MTPSRRLISIVIPCFNEIENVDAIYKSTKSMLENELNRYDYEILFIDNKSTDGTRDKIRTICKADANVKAILNAQNFGQFNSPFHALREATGDCAVLMSADFQDPVEMVPKFVAEWEAGYKIVCGIKTQSKENALMYLLRTVYYRLIRRMASIEHIDHFMGFGLYDRAFLDVLKSLDDPMPYLRGIVSELGFEHKCLEYVQPERRAGKSHYNWYSLYDAAMIGFTSYTKAGMRLATFVGFAMSGLSLLAAVVYLILKLTNWDMWPAGSIPVLLSVLVLGSLQLFFIGLLGEYVMSTNTRTMRRPLVIEEERINFESTAQLEGQ